MATTISHNCELNHDSNINIDPFYVEVQISNSLSESKSDSWAIVLVVRYYVLGVSCNNNFCKLPLLLQLRSVLLFSLEWLLPGNPSQNTFIDIDKLQLVQFY